MAQRDPGHLHILKNSTLAYYIDDIVLIQSLDALVRHVHGQKWKINPQISGTPVLGDFKTGFLKWEKNDYTYTVHQEGSLDLLGLLDLEALHTNFRHEAWWTFS